jgi:hypothetical protein
MLNFIEIRPVGSEIKHAEDQTDMTTEYVFTLCKEGINSFSSFRNETYEGTDRYVSILCKEGTKSSANREQNNVTCWEGRMFLIEQSNYQNP